MFYNNIMHILFYMCAVISYTIADFFEDYSFSDFTKSCIYIIITIQIQYSKEKHFYEVYMIAV